MTSSLLSISPNLPALAGPLSTAGPCSRFYSLQEVSRDCPHLLTAPPPTSSTYCQPETLRMRSMGLCEVRVSCSVLPQACCFSLPCSELPKGVRLWQAALQSPPPSCLQSNHAGEQKATTPWSTGEARDRPSHPIQPAFVTFVDREMTLCTRFGAPNLYDFIHYLGQPPSKP